MNAKQETQNYERKVTGAERFFSHAPFSTVTVVARIKGNVTERDKSKLIVSFLKSLKL
jgi:hypothetical protein